MEETQEEVKFECQQCGMCCVGFWRIKVSLIGQDLVELAKAVPNVYDYVEFVDLKLSKNNLKATWVKTDKEEGYIVLKYKDLPTSPCVFLKDNKCTVYNHRPDMCRMFPFDFGVNVIDSNKGRDIEIDIAFRDFCKGIGKGDNIDLKDLGDKTIASYNACLDWKKFVERWNENPRSFETLLEELIKRYG